MHYRSSLAQLAATVVLTVTAFSCAAQSSAPPAAIPPSPPVQPDARNFYWVLLEDMVYRIGTTNVDITVPAGFVTDFASIPQGLWSLGLSPHGLYSRAAVVHDYLYWSQGCTKEQADRLLLIAMKESDVGWFDEKVIYLGVSTGGAKSWQANAQERLDKKPRVLPRHLRRFAPGETWPQRRKIAMAMAVQDPDFPLNPSYCAFGDSTEVPGGIATSIQSAPPSMTILRGE